jgi:predicted RNase H-like nuclease (RuvC/YqgF family)
MKTEAAKHGDPRHHADDIAALKEENATLCDVVDALRSDVARLTRERDEWEANEQAQARRVTKLEAKNGRLLERALSAEGALGQLVTVADNHRALHRSHFGVAP